MGLPIEHGDFHSYVKLPEGMIPNSYMEEKPESKSIPKSYKTPTS